MAANLLEVRLEPRQGRLDPKEFKRVSNELTARAGQVVAEAARKRMAEMISPGHKFNVGASGASAKNLKVERIDRKVGYVTWAVIEGDDTPANAAIRYGIKPGAAPPISKLRQWAITKRIAFKDPSELKDEGAKGVRYIKSRMNDPRHRDRPAREFKRDTQKLNRALYAIQQAIFREGTNRGPDPNRGTKGANWWRLYPANQGRFDYVAYAVKQERYFYDAVDRASSAAVRGIVDYIASGRKTSGHREFTVRD